ncbi:MAG: MOSC domain-containing protein [Pseudonocardia sp.]|nr:MOSC domain-containing protein [Pseudonocardia sp.]
MKSMLGEDLPGIELDQEGVRGDRLWALRTSAGRIGAAKRTPRYVRLPRLLEMSARLDEDGETAVVRVGARELRSDDPRLDGALSAVVGEPVVLARGPHLDAEPVHLVTTASLRWWSDRVPEEKADWRRLRPNLVLDVPGIGRVEDGWVGRRLRVGPVVLRVVDQTERCLMLPQDQLGLGHAPQLLRALARHGLTLGVYARVFIPGAVHRGDPVVLD